MIILGCFGGTPIFGNTYISAAEVENTGVQLIRQASAKTNDVAGDGTTYPGFPRDIVGGLPKIGGIYPQKWMVYMKIMGKTPFFKMG